MVLLNMNCFDSGNKFGYKQFQVKFNDGLSLQIDAKCILAKQTDLSILF